MQMVMYVVSGIVAFLVILNMILGKTLYKEPKNEDFFHNVRKISVPKERYIFPEPKYVLGVSVITGLAIGMYIGLCKLAEIASPISIIVTILVAIAYLLEIAKGISLTENRFNASSFFFRSEEFCLRWYSRDLSL